MQVQVLRKYPGSAEVGAIVSTDGWAVNRAHQLIKRRLVQPVIRAEAAPLLATEEPRRGPGRPRKTEVTQ